MAIKMRHNDDPDAVCCECGDGQNDVLNMFDICIGGVVHTICDLCNEAILNKTLSAECWKNHRTKTPRDMGVKRRRHAKEKEMHTQWANKT